MAASIHHSRAVLLQRLPGAMEVPGVFITDTRHTDDTPAAAVPTHIPRQQIQQAAKIHGIGFDASCASIDLNARGINHVVGDALRDQMESGVGVLAASFENGKNTMLAVVSDDLRDRGVSADAILRELAAAAGGKGGGKPHMAQAGIPDAARMASVVADAPEMIRKHLALTP